MGMGTRLKELRLEHKLTLKQVAEHLGVTPTTISCYEHETRQPSPKAVKKLAEFYHTTTDDIIGGNTEEITNLEVVLSNHNRQLHWGGIPLREDELNFIRDFLELRVRDKGEKEDKNII